MLAQKTVRTYEVNQAFRHVEGITLDRKSRQIFFLSEKALFFFICTQHVLSYHQCLYPSIVR